jgi:lipopolysaccharide/colanic/teichoic acid biosynthesis glycosyltransferase
MQKRVGIGGGTFRLIKFRTMSLKNDSDLIEFEPGNINRITPFGKFLRKTKIDELPQLINVFKGEMSFVGPRPEVLEWTKIYPEKWKIVHSVKPGITDNASLIFRNEEEILIKSQNPSDTYKNEILPQKLEVYVNYVSNRSFFSDIKIIFKTLKEVIVR